MKGAEWQSEAEGIAGLHAEASDGYWLKAG